MNNEHTIETISQNAKDKIEKIYKFLFNAQITLSEEKEDSEETLLFSEREPVALLIVLDGQNPTYYPQKIVYNSGVRYYPDGTGEPPSFDFYDLEQKGTDSLDKAVILLMNFLFETKISDYFESEIMDYFEQE